MIRYIIISITSGILFGIMDGLIHANPIARKVYQIFQPISRTSINIPAGIVIDLAYGFIMSGIFLLLFKSLPGETGLSKGISFAIIAWFFRVLMSAVSNWMMFDLSFSTVLYSLVAGLFEMLILGILYGLTLKPTT